MHNHQQLMQMLQQQQLPTHITTEHIQQYLDENKALILRILENQNMGKLNECAENQARLQRNLMYLAAIADTQPPMHGQFDRSAMVTQPGASYLQQQQTQQSPMAAQSPMLYAQHQQHYSAMQQQQYPALHQQQILNEQLGMSLAGSSSKHHMLQNEASVGGTNEGGAYPEFSPGSVGEGTIRRVGGTGKQVAGSDRQAGTSGGGRFGVKDEGHDYY